MVRRARTTMSGRSDCFAGEETLELRSEDRRELTVYGEEHQVKGQL